MHGTLDTVFRVEWRPLSDLEGIVEAWRDLAERTIESNVFYEPAFALSAAPVLGRGAGAILVWTRNSPARLLGLFPARCERRYGFGPKVLSGWTHPFAPFGTPLVDATNATAVIAAWLDYVAQDAALRSVLLLPMISLDGPFARALDEVLALRSVEAADFNVHRRALVDPGSERDTYVATATGAKHRKELGRRRRRLLEAGTVTHDVITSEHEVVPPLAHFLALEQSGWKGRAGTAAAQDADIRGFFEAAVMRLAAEGKARIDLLRLDGQVIAAAIALRSGDTMFGWKTAYDESQARFSPGALLMLDLTQSILKDPRVMKIDSCATEGHPMISHLWRERRVISDRMFAATPKARRRFAVSKAFEHGLRKAIAVAKAVRDRLRNKGVIAS